MKGIPVATLNDEKWLPDLAFFVDITGHLNVLNEALQSKIKM